MIIDNLNLKDFKAAKNIGLENLANINYLVGENGSGKSSLLEAVTLASKFGVRGMQSVDVGWWGSVSLVLNKGNAKLEIGYPEARAFVSFKPENDTAVTLDEPGTYITYEGGGSDNGRAAIIFDTAFLDDAAEESEYGYFKQRMEFSKDEISDQKNEDALRSFLDKHYCKPNEVVDIIYRSTGTDLAIKLRIVDKDNRTLIHRDESLRSLARGFHHLMEFYFSLRRQLDRVLASSNGGGGVIMIEEPEIHLHPHLQKLIPSILSDFIEEFGEDKIQFIVSTHSPFIASEAARQKNQKIYLIKDGVTVNMAGEPNPSSSGYKGEKCLSVVSSMLGAGFADISPSPVTFTLVKLIYCEGRKKNINDAKLYSEIFRDRESCLFLSCGSAHEVIDAYHVAKAVAPFILGEEGSCELLIDRSDSHRDIVVGECFLGCTGPGKPMFTDSERTSFLAYDKSFHMLKRKEIENYIFDPTVVAHLNDAERASFTIPDDLDYVSGEVKDLVKNVTPEIKKKLAKIIYDHRVDDTKAIYDELNECLTNSA